MKISTHAATNPMPGGYVHSAAYPHRKKPRVLFAMSAEEGPTEALQRACAFAHSLEAELLVLSVISEPSAGDTPPHLMSTHRAIALGKEIFRLAQRVYEVPLPLRLGSENLVARQGSFLSTVVEVAVEYAADLIVLPATEGKNGQQVTKLARLTQIPVLIARPTGLTETIVAASDLEDRECPILKKAYQLSQTLDAPMVLVHNVQPTLNPIDASWPNEEALRYRKQQLEQASGVLAPNADTVVLSTLSTVEAILTVAEQKSADLIVVGAYRRGWLDKLLSSGVAAQVAEKAHNSVLVTPLFE